MRYQAKDTADVVYKYPCNLSVLQNSLGISHSEYSKNLAIKEYGYANILNGKRSSSSNASMGI